jgi:hypothetical protein
MQRSFGFCLILKEVQLAPFFLILTNYLKSLSRTNFFTNLNEFILIPRQHYLKKSLFLTEIYFVELLEFLDEVP